MKIPPSRVALEPFGFVQPRVLVAPSFHPFLRARAAFTADRFSLRPKRSDFCVFFFQRETRDDAKTRSFV